MSLDEFRQICNEVFEMVPIIGAENDGEPTKHRRRLFPSGCDTCTSGNEWDCKHEGKDGTIVLCSWRENYWKYEEIKTYISLEKSERGGLDLNRIESLNYIDFLKLGILKEYL